MSTQASDKRPGSTITRRKCFHFWRYQTEHGWRMKCAGCGREIHPASEPWEADHLIVHAHGGSDEPPNIRPLCSGKGSCHATKTKRDISFIAKGKRQSDSIYGVKRPSSTLRKRDGYRYDWQQRRYVREEVAE